jgi:hypothetical protein
MGRLELGKKIKISTETAYRFVLQKKSPIGQKLDFANHPYLCKGLNVIFNGICEFNGFIFLLIPTKQTRIQPNLYCQING